MSRRGSRPCRARWTLQRKASTVGFDWNDTREVLKKIREEADEIEAALDDGDKQELAEETGDLLFALVNLARHVDANPEMALRSANAKFEKRFGYIERALAAKGRSLDEATLEEMDALWDEAKGKTNQPAAEPLRGRTNRERAAFLEPLSVGQPSQPVLGASARMTPGAPS